jgi:hypothetical protein
MTVDIRCNAVRRMPEHLLYDVERAPEEINADAAECRSVCKPTPASPARSAMPAKALSAFRGFVGGRCGWEHQVWVFLPGRPGRRCEPLRYLRRPMALERLGSRGGEWHESPGFSHSPTTNSCGSGPTVQPTSAVLSPLALPSRASTTRSPSATIREASARSAHHTPPRHPRLGAGHPLP